MCGRRLHQRHQLPERLRQGSAGRALAVVAAQALLLVVQPSPKKVHEGVGVQQALQARVHEARVAQVLQTYQTLSRRASAADAVVARVAALVAVFATAPGVGCAVVSAPSCCLVDIPQGTATATGSGTPGLQSDVTATTAVAGGNQSPGAVVPGVIQPPTTRRFHADAGVLLAATFSSIVAVVAAATILPRKFLPNNALPRQALICRRQRAKSTATISLAGYLFPSRTVFRQPGDVKSVYGRQAPIKLCRHRPRRRRGRGTPGVRTPAAVPVATLMLGTTVPVLPATHSVARRSAAVGAVGFSLLELPSPVYSATSSRTIEPPTRSFGLMEPCFLVRAAGRAGGSTTRRRR